jgi:NifB/MoaA-like Fe-S oxidoreductase
VQITPIEGASQMSLRMIQSKIRPERVADVEAAAKKVHVALNAAQPEGIRWASCVQPDEETIVALLQVDDGVENPLFDLPEYKELLEVVEGSRAEPPLVEAWTVLGSYRLF